MKHFFTNEAVVKSQERAFMFYFVLPTIITAIFAVLMFALSIVDVSVFGWGKYYGVMEVPSAFLCLFIWWVIGAVLCIAIYWFTKIACSYKILHISYLKTLIEKDIVCKGNSNEISRCEEEIIDSLPNVTSTEAKTSQQTVEIKKEPNNNTVKPQQSQPKIQLDEKKCLPIYVKALKLFNEKKYQEAYNYLIRIKGYKNVNSLILQIKAIMPKEDIK